MVLYLMIHILLAFICFMFIIFISILFIPVKYKGEAYIKDKFSAEAYIGWFFGLVKFTAFKGEEDSKIRFNFTFCGVNISINSFKKKQHKEKEKKEKAKRKNRLSRKIINIFYSYFKDILSILKPKYFSAVGTYSFEDPSITGIICGLIGIIKGVFSMSNINLEPVFEEEENNIKIEIYGRVINCMILARTLKLIINKEVRKIFFSKKEKNVKHLKTNMCIK